MVFGQLFNPECQKISKSLEHNFLRKFKVRAPLQITFAFFLAFDHIRTPPSLHFLCSKSSIFLTTYPPLNANVICEGSLNETLSHFYPYFISTGDCWIRGLKCVEEIRRKWLPHREPSQITFAFRGG